MKAKKLKAKKIALLALITVTLFTLFIAGTSPAVAGEITATPLNTGRLTAIPSNTGKPAATSTNAGELTATNAGKLTAAPSNTAADTANTGELAAASQNADEIYTIYEKTSENIVAKGVKRKNIVRFTNKGWLNINIIQADLSQKHLDIELLTDPRGVSYMSSVLDLARENGAVASINGDFFQKLRGAKDRGSSVGVIVKDGNLLSSPAGEEGMAAMSIDKDDYIFFNYWKTDIVVTAPNGEKASVKHINKYDPLDSIVLYDSSWNSYSLGTEYNNAVEVIVQNNIVKEIRKNMPPVKIPENGYILSNLPEYNPFLIDNFKAGDPVKLDIYTEPDFNKLKMALGGGTLLVKDGDAAEFTHNIKGLHPRSAVGTDASGKTLYMVTVDGRQIRSRGMTLEQFSRLLIDLGIHNAINLDGGGSSTLAAKSLGKDELRIINSVSDGTPRNVINAVGIKSSAPKTGVAAGLIIESTSENVFVNTSRTFTVSAYDKNYNAVDINPKKVRWSVRGVKGKFTGNTLYPQSVGHGVVTARYGKVKADYHIDVLSSPASITISPKKIHLSPGDTVELTVTGKNRMGYSAPINPSDVSWNIPSQTAVMENNRIKALKGGAGIISAAVGKVTSYAALTVDLGTTVEDFEKDNAVLLTYPSGVSGSYSLSSKRKKSGNYSGKLTFDFTANTAQTSNTAQTLNTGQTSNTGQNKAVYCKFKDKIAIDPKAKKIGLWVYANKYMNHWLRAMLQDAENNNHLITLARKIDWDGWKYVEASIPGNISYPLYLTRLYIVQIDPEIKNKGSVYFDDLQFIFPQDNENITIPEDIKLPDELNKPAVLPDDKNSFSFSVFGSTIERKTLLQNLVMVKTLNTFNKTSDISAFVGEIDIKALDGLNTRCITTKGYFMFDFKGSTFMHLDNSNDGFRKTNPDQWLWFIDAVENIKNKNVFIFLPKPLTGKNGFTDIYEANLFKDMLTEKLAKKNKTVFVFYNDDSTRHYIDRGVRYISTAGIKVECNSDNIEALVQETKYVLVKVNGDNVSYQIERIFK